MNRKNKLINKVKYLLRKIEAPRFLHHFGPKTYELWQHIFALFVKCECQLSYRRVSRLLRDLGFKVATKSTLQRYAAKLCLPFWQKMFEITISKTSNLVCMDGTGLEKTKASQHYIKRIDGKKPFSKAFQFGIIVGENSKILSLRIRKKYTHDITDAKYLVKRLTYKPKIILMDKGYDSEKLHRYFAEQNIWSVAPVKKNWAKRHLRKKLTNNFPKKLYNKRNKVESIFHAFKQKFGSNINSKNIRPARSEVFCKAILYNLFLRICYHLGQTPSKQNL